MELKKPVVVCLHPWPAWFRAALASMPNKPFDAFQRRRVITEWWRARYDAEFKVTAFATATLTFPSQEAYTECILTWS